MSFNGCSSFQVNAKTIANNVYGNQSYTTTNNRDSYNTYNTKSYGDRSVITNGGQATITMGGGGSGGRRKKKKRSVSQDSTDSDDDDESYGRNPQQRPHSAPLQNHQQMLPPPAGYGPTQFNPMQSLSGPPNGQQWYSYPNSNMNQNFANPQTQNWYTNGQFSTGYLPPPSQHSQFSPAPPPPPASAPPHLHVHAPGQTPIPEFDRVYSQNPNRDGVGGLGAGFQPDQHYPPRETQMSEYDRHQAQGSYPNAYSNPNLNPNLHWGPAPPFSPPPSQHPQYQRPQPHPQQYPHQPQYQQQQPQQPQQPQQYLSSHPPKPSLDLPSPNPQHHLPHAHTHQSRQSHDRSTPPDTHAFHEGRGGVHDQQFPPGPQSPPQRTYESENPPTLRRGGDGPSGMGHSRSLPPPDNNNTFNPNYVGARNGQERINHESENSVWRSGGIGTSTSGDGTSVDGAASAPSGGVTDRYNTSAGGAGGGSVSGLGVDGNESVRDVNRRGGEEREGKPKKQRTIKSFFVKK